MLSLALILGLVPGMSLTAYADDTPPYANLKNTTTVITFDGKPWYLTDYDDTTVTLLSKECVASSKYNENGSFVEYSSNPTVKTAVDDWYNHNITADAQTAVSGGAMFLLTIDEANAITNAEVRKDATATGYWWLCSQGTDYAGNAAYAGGEYGLVYAYGTNVENTLGVRPALKLNLSSVIFSSESNIFSLKPAGSSVTLSGGANATIDGATSQTGLTGAMTTVTYTANTGYYFAEFTDITDNGITAKRTSSTVVTVSGTPTADATITVPDAVEKTTATYTNLIPTSSDTDLTSKQVTFNGYKWYIIADNSTAVDAGTVTLLAADTSFGTSKFHDSSNAYKDSTVRSKLVALTAEGGSFAGVKDAIVDTDLTDVNVTGAKLYLLSTSEAGPYANFYFTGAQDGSWWLRSQGSSGLGAAIVYGETGHVYGYGSDVSTQLGVRPALQLNLSSVIFSSESNAFSLKQTIAAENVTVTYGDTDKKVSASVTKPATSGGAISYTVKTGSEDFIAVDSTTGALTIKKVPSDGRAYVIVTAAESGNYGKTTKEVTVTINKANAAPATVTANNCTYDGAEKPLVAVTGTVTGGTMQYALGTETEATQPYTTSIPTATDAGTYYVWYRVVGDANHLDTAAARLTSIVAPEFGDPDFVMPEDLTAIQESAFEGVASMVVVDAHTCAAIGKDAFKDTGLAQIRLPKDCEISDAAFDEEGLVYVYAPAGGTTQAYCEAYDNLVFIEE